MEVERGKSENQGEERVLRLFKVKMVESDSRCQKWRVQFRVPWSGETR